MCIVSSERVNRDLISDVRCVAKEKEREKYRQMSQTQLMISSSLEPVLRDQEWSNT